MCFRPPNVQKPQRCPECKSMNPGNVKLCRKCGAEMPPPEVPMIKCPSCGADNPIDADECQECGLTAAEAMKLMKK